MSFQIILKKQSIYQMVYVNHVILFCILKPGPDNKKTSNITQITISQLSMFISLQKNTPKLGKMVNALVNCAKQAEEKKKITRFSPNLLSPYISGPRTEQSRYNFYYLFTFAIQSNNMMIGVKIIEFIYFLKIKIT